jgi:hypothetical protein
MDIRQVLILTPVFVTSLSMSILLLTIITEDNNYVLAQSTSSNQSGNNNNNNNNNTTSIEGLGYDTKNMTHYSAKQEWQPHLGQANSFVEWWYVTTLLHDSAGNQYMLFDVIFKYDSKLNPFVMAQPEIATKMGPSQSYIMLQMELSNYNTGFHFADVEPALMNRTAMWDSNTNTLNYKTANYTGS